MVRSSSELNKQYLQAQPVEAVRVVFVLSDGLVVPCLSCVGCDCLLRQKTKMNPLDVQEDDGPDPPGWLRWECPYCDLELTLDGAEDVVEESYKVLGVLRDRIWSLNAKSGRQEGSPWRKLFVKVLSMFRH